MNEFKQISVSEIGITITGKTPSSKSLDDFGNEFIFITPSDDFNSKYISQTERLLSDIGFKKLKSKALPPNSILVTCIGSAMGKVSMNYPIAVTNQQINSIIPSENFDNDYVYYQLKNNYHLLRNAASGSTALPILNKTDFDLLKLNFHKIKSKQTKVASVLSKLDYKIKLNNQINDNLERIAKTLYDYWFVQFDFPDENGKPYKSSGGKMVWNGVLKREIPEGWEFQTIEELGTITGGSTPSKTIKENFSKHDIPWITPKDLSQNIGNKFITRGEFDVTEKGFKEASLNILPANSVLMSSRAPIGYLAINRFDCTTNQGFKSIICNKEYPFEYIFYVLKQNMLSIEANASGSTFKEISTAVLKTIKILKPQKRLVNQFKNIASVIFQQQNNLEQQNQQLSSLRDWLLPMLMNGQVKVE